MKKHNIIDNRYIVLKEIGEGGFATVYKAWASNLERFVAVKKIHQDYSKDAKFLDMFRNEAVNTAKLDNQNIVRVIDFLRTSQNLYYIIMEYANGRDLRYLLQQCKKKNMRIPFGLCMYILCETLKALKYANNLKDDITNKQLDIVHRDISPGNIMLYFDGRVKLTDFGIAKVSTQFGEKLKEGVLRGKVAYMSPEQANGAVDIDHRSDLFSIGIVLYEMLTGKHLFQGKSDYEIWTNAKKAKLDLNLIEKASHIPVPIKNILKKALMQDRADRYQTAAAMIKDIQKFFGNAYEVQSDGLTEFLNRCMPAEIESEKADAIPTHTELHTQPESEPQVHLPEVSKKPVPEKTPFQQTMKDLPHDEPKQEISPGEKTVFDFVLDTAKKHEKILLLSLLSLFLGAITFAGIDIYKQITPVGLKVHGYLWPPALTIDSFPVGADVSLMKGSKKITDEGSTTPLNIDKLVPGNYTLRITKKGFLDIERRISVKGKNHIYASGNVYTQGKQKNYFLFPFEVPLNIVSKPPGASVYINGKKIPGKTPLRHSMEIGKHTIQLFMEGFEPLGSSDRTPSYGQCWVDLENIEGQQKGMDRRFWTYSKKMKAGIKEYVVSGIFWKSISIYTDPKGAAVFIDDEKTERGMTPLTDEKLKVGSHIIRIAKKGYKTEEKTITISSETKDTLKYSMLKYVWFRSYGTDNPDKDLEASVTIKGTKISNWKTPFKASLPLKNFKAQFSKNKTYGSQSKSFKVRSVSSVTAKLKLKNPFVKIIVKVSNTQEPVHNVYILFNDVYMGSTDDHGIWKGFVEVVGDVTIKINSGDRFSEKKFNLSLALGSRQTKDIYLNPPSNGTLYIDTRPHFIGAQIYVDDVYQNETIRKITKMTGGIHSIRIRHYDLENDIESEVNFTKPDQTIKVKLNAQGEFIIKGQK